MRAKEVVYGPVKKHLANGCVRTNKTQSYAHASKPWSWGNVYMNMSCSGGDQVPHALKWGPVG
jgi:hypothetical protein